MELRDRTASLALFGGAIVAWFVVAVVVLTRDPLADPSVGFLGAALMGLAVGLTAIPLFWLSAFARHGRIALRGDWTRAVRRGGWVGVVVVILVVLRLQDAFQWPIALFVVAMVVVAEVSLSVER
ncbi:MAG TPA: hypothetical protein VJZ72_08205 [Candidatus Limnocylindrales bacterium]|nr:hypothetical protein [Candidatus Limnocylindrales bacterium]